ncbi:MAG: TolC family protein [Verrucomicrobia bacterium]|nr:TolC family protein [Verrucomicrobiota bacterium]
MSFEHFQRPNPASRPAPAGAGLRRGTAVMFVCAACWFPAAEAAEPWTFEQAVSFALTNSPDARIAQQRIAAARAGIAQADAAVWPKLQFQSSYGWTDNPMLAFGAILNQRAFSPSLDFNDVPSTDNLNLRGVVTAPLYAGGQIRAGRTAARAGAQAAAWEAEAVRSTLGFEVARAFHTVLKTRAFIQATEAAVNGYEQNVNVARKRYQAGTLLRADLLDVEVRLAQSREDLVRARNAEALAERALRNLLGVETPGFAVANTVPEFLPPAAAASPAQRPELLALRQRELAAEAAVRGARGGYLPKLSAFGSLDYDRGWETGGDGGSYAAGALLQFDLWDGKLTRAKVSEARARLEEIQEEHRKWRLAIDLEVEQARLNLEEARARLAVTDTAISQAQESVELTRARFEQGLALATQLIDAETALTGARVRRAEAEADRRIAVAALRRALGLPQLEPR